MRADSGLLARHLLLERSRLDLPPALERIGGIQAQSGDARRPLSRLDGFEPTP